MDRQTVEHWTDILIDDWQMNRWTDGQIDRWTERQDTLEWRTPRRSGDSLSFPAVLSLSGSIPGVGTVWLRYGGTSNRSVSPPLQTQELTTTTKQIKLTYSYQSAESHYFINILPLAIYWSFALKESNKCTSLCWRFACNYILLSNNH